MFIEDYIIFRVNALLHSHNSKIVKRLEGGMSNYTYVVENEGKMYTYRVPGKFAERFVDRVEEWENIQEVNRLGLNNITEYVEIRSGEKLAEYAEENPQQRPQIPRLQRLRALGHLPKLLPRNGLHLSARVFRLAQKT